MKSDIINTIESIKGGLSLEELMALLSHPNQSVRGSAVQSLVERFEVDVRTVCALRDFIGRPENLKPAMGAVSLSHLAMKLLSTIEQPEAKAAFAALEHSWKESDRADLEWFLAHG